MSAAEHLHPRQFGPGGKYTTRLGTPDYSSDSYRPITTPDEAEHHASMHEKYGSSLPHYVEAVHTASGRRIGAMNVFTPSKDGTPHAQGSPDPTKAAIYKVTVSKSMRRKGMATAMLDHMRDVHPGLQHSGPQALSEDGAAWARRRP